MILPGFALLLLPIITFYAECATIKMIVVYGIPSGLAYGQANKTLTTQSQCIAACYYSDTCVVAYKDVATCYLYMYDRMPSIVQKNSTNGSPIAFKILVPDDTCPIGKNPPTFNGANATGYLFHTAFGSLTKTYYNFTYTSFDRSWSFSYRSYPRCDKVVAGYLQRSDGNDMCVGIYTVARGLQIDQSLANQTCSNLGATLPAINYPTDTAYYRSFIKGHLTADMFYTSDFYIRIDGVRKTTCQANPTSSTCMSAAGFTFTDKGFKNFNNYAWVTNSAARATSDDDCLVYVVKANNTANMKVDVRSCTNKSPYPAIAHFCVKAAYT